jgi:signal transduction histidine kinase
VLSIIQEGNSVVSVTDNGGGIPDEVLEKIGTLYFTTKASGTGIGLHMCRTILENHFHGRLKIDNIGDGARFQVVIPLAMPENAAPGTAN